MRFLEKMLMNEGTEIWRIGSGKWWLLGTVMMEPVSPFFDSKEKAVDYGIKSGRFSPAIRDRLLADKGEDGIGGPETFKQDESVGMERLGRLVEAADVPMQHQIKIAISTLKMPDAMVGVMGGPNKEQAREILKTKAGWSDKRIAALEEVREATEYHKWLWELVGAKIKTEVEQGNLFGIEDDLPPKRKAQVLVKPEKLIQIPEPLAFEMGDPVTIVGNVASKGKSGKVDWSKNGFAVVVDKNGKGIGSFHWSDLKLRGERKEGAWPLMSEPSR